MATAVIIKHPNSGMIKIGYYGFSWTYLFFGWFVPLFRGELGVAALHMLFSIITLGLWQIIVAFLYNRQYMTRMFMNGWVLADTNKDPFEIQLSEDGAASGTHGKDMKYGTWEEKDGQAIINWRTGWITVIAKEGDQYIKKAFKPGISITDKPTNTSSAKRK